MNKLLQALGYRYKRIDLLEEALTHSSCRTPYSYERLEFLGDRLLSAYVGILLFHHFPGEEEGGLARRQNNLVCQPILADCARRLNVEAFIRHAPDVLTTESILCDVFEALIGSIYEDGGWQAAQDFVHQQFLPLLSNPDINRKDAKTALQEWAHAAGWQLPVYKVISHSGPDHHPVFNVHVEIPGHSQTYTGSGRSKKDAAQHAAIGLLKQLQSMKEYKK